MKICTYRAGVQADFYIQSKGNHAGRPLKTPIPNCFAVSTKKPFAYQIFYCLFKMKIYYPYIGGTTVPFLSLYDFKKIAHPALEKQYDEVKLNAISRIQNLIEIEKRKIEMYHELEYTLSIETYKNGK
jgi:restriction endonuclease S subunit